MSRLLQLLPDKIDFGFGLLYIKHQLKIAIYRK